MGNCFNCWKFLKCSSCGSSSLTITEFDHKPRTGYYLACDNCDRQYVNRIRRQNINH